jgi:hypothetical protein
MPLVVLGRRPQLGIVGALGGRGLALDGFPRAVEPSKPSEDICAGGENLNLKPNQTLPAQRV